MYYTPQFPPPYHCRQNVCLRCRRILLARFARRRSKQTQDRTRANLQRDADLSYTEARCSCLYSGVPQHRRAVVWLPLFQRERLLPDALAQSSKFYPSQRHRQVDEQLAQATNSARAEKRFRNQYSADARRGDGVLHHAEEIL